MITETSTTPATDPDDSSAPDSFVQGMLRRVSRLEMAVGAAIAIVMLVLVLIEPEILEAPFENGRTLLFTFGGTALAAIGFAAMLWLRIPPIVRVIVLVVPFAIVNWWLISPYFIDDVVNEEFSTSISEQLVTTDESDSASAPATTAAPASEGQTESTAADASEEEPATEEQPVETTATEAPAPTGPVLLGAGQFVGLAGHSGTGDAGIFENPDGSLLLRFENFDIQNGPDLEVYLVPGADQDSLADGSIHLGALEGNIGDQTYELPPGTELDPGVYTALVWCEAFSVEFVGATIEV